MISLRKSSYNYIVIISLLLTVHCSLLNVIAQDTIRLSIPSFYACDGDTLLIPVNATKFKNVGSVGIKLKYDVANLIPKGLKNVNPALNGFLFNESNGHFNFAWVTTNIPANIGNGKLFDLVFIYSGGISSLSFLSGCEIVNLSTLKPYKLSLIDGFINDTAGYSINGKVIYDNSHSTRLQNIKLVLYNNEGLGIDSTFSDSLGMYSFNKVLCGSYSIKACSNIKTGGINPVDALLILRFFVSLYTINDPLKKKIADVNNDGKINSIDALLICRRFVKLINNFPSGDWQFDNTTFNVRNYFLYDIKGICYGDIDGSYIPFK